MKLSRLLWRVGLFLSVPAILATLLLYLYPVVLRCSFPTPSKPGAGRNPVGQESLQDASVTNAAAPFRLLALGDPQLEGDSSLPRPDAPIFPSLNEAWDEYVARGPWIAFRALGPTLKDLARKDIPKLLWSYRKRLDLFGNDYYLAHIYRTLHWWLEPTHVTVLGDLIGSQWVSDQEFDWRGWRFWNRVFRKGQRVEDSITGSSTHEILGEDARWSRRLINVAGNHDIGYAGDIDRTRADRFERVYGPLNWDIKFHAPLLLNNNTKSPSSIPTVDEQRSLHIIVLNDMNLDEPAYDEQLQAETYDFINGRVLPNSHAVEERKTATIILTHIPMHKEAGVCVDGPLFTYSDRGIKEQNHLSKTATKAVLESVLGMSGDADAPARGHGRNGIIINGHDHEGCDVYHYIPPDAPRDGAEWKAVPLNKANDVANNGEIPGVREVTVRSMMGSFGGNAGLLSAWFDEDLGEWRFEYSTCAVGVQHIWWAVHVTDLVTLLVFAAGFAVYAMEQTTDVRITGSDQKTLKRPGKGSKKQTYVNGSMTSTSRPSKETPRRHRRKA